MGFFSQNATFTEGKLFSVAETGIYACALTEIELTDRPTFDDPSITEKTFKWVFESTEVGDEEGQPFRFVAFTKTNYGYDRAKITALLDGMLGRRLARQEFMALDVNELRTGDWSVMVSAKENMRGKMVNVVEKVTPRVKAAPKLLKKVAVLDSIDDPFED